MPKAFILVLFLSSFLLSPFLDGQGTSLVFAKPKIHISDDLHDVVDSEEDEEWKEWGKPKRTIDPTEVDRLNAMSSEDAVNHLKSKGPDSGPTMVFVKLRMDGRSPEGTSEIVVRWRNLLKTGGIGASIFPVDQNTLLLNLEFGQDVDELKDFVLSQDDAYEIKIGENTHRREGDLSMEELAKKEFEEQQAKKKTKKKSKKSKAKKNKKEL
eukprot:TRINITY_DN19273_c0_g1_i1.p1 TRINITY_DN19273_c0_g1~~TRINITY_DN19273_c0_g1_i1.p1  ORF type:complete len:211 (+),score=55.48 TRINITY_DN19273_c0_g1_i1:89-721(+)